MKPFKNEPRMNHEARITILENSIMNIHSFLLDFKQDMKHGFEKIDKKFERIENKFDAIDNKFIHLEEKFDKKFTQFDNKFARIESRLWSNFLWLIGAIGGLAGLIAHTQHWV